MTEAGVRAYQENEGRQGVYAYENALKELTAAETAAFRKNKAAWADWEKRPPSYRKTILHWIAAAKKPETRARRLATLIADSAAASISAAIARSADRTTRVHLEGVRDQIGKILNPEAGGARLGAAAYNEEAMRLLDLYLNPTSCWPDYTIKP